VHALLARRVEDSEERARHLALAAPRPEGGIALELERAARGAAARGASDAAAELAELAVRLTPEDDASTALRRRIELANFLYAAGNGPAAIAALEAVCAAAPAGPVRNLAMVDLGGIYPAIGEHARGAALLDQALAEIDDPVLAAQAHTRRAWISHLEPELVIRHCRAVLELIDEEDAPDLYSFALQHLAFALLCTGREAAHNLIERSLPGQRSADMWTLSSIGARWPMFFDDFAAARERHVELIAHAEERGNEPERQSELAYLALIELWTGHPREAEALAREALADQIEQEPMACVSRYVLGLAVAQLGRLQEAGALARQTLAWIGPHPPDPAFILATQAYAVLGFAALSGGDLADADRWLTRAGEASARWAEPAPFRFHADQAEAATRLGDLDRAEVLVARLERRAGRIPRPWICTVAARCRGLLQAARGDLDGARAALDEAVESQAALAMPLERGRGRVTCPLRAVGSAALGATRRSGPRAPGTRAESGRAYGYRAGDRRTCRRRADEPRDRRSGVRDGQDCGVATDPRLSEAGGAVAHPALPSVARAIELRDSA
jgi:tetratricopeptide (TPR) repeat protein